MRKKKRVLRLLLCCTMVCSLSTQTVYANVASAGAALSQPENGLCGHHPVHDESCGYAEATGGLCEHIHTDKCFLETTDCVHVHNADCYPQEEETTMEASPSDALEATECGHICSGESGCIETVLVCGHESGKHDEDCGYEPVTADMPCTYECEICGNESKAAEKKTSDPPVITKQPQDIAAYIGQDVVFSVEAEGEDLQYQWYESYGSEWSSMEGENQPTLTLSNISYALNGYRYRCEIRNNTASTLSDEVSLSVEPALRTLELNKSKMTFFAGGTIGQTVEVILPEGYEYLADSIYWYATDPDCTLEADGAKATIRNVTREGKVVAELDTPGFYPPPAAECQILIEGAPFAEIHFNPYNDAQSLFAGEELSAKVYAYYRGIMTADDYRLSITTSADDTVILQEPELTDETDPYYDVWTLPLTASENVTGKTEVTLTVTISPVAEGLFREASRSKTLTVYPRPTMELVLTADSVEIGDSITAHVNLQDESGTYSYIEFFPDYNDGQVEIREVENGIYTITGSREGAVVLSAKAYDRNYRNYLEATGTIQVTKKHEHTLSYVPENSANCTEDGTKAHWTCTECGKLFASEAGTQEVKAEELVTPALGHLWSASWEYNETHHWRICERTGCPLTNPDEMSEYSLHTSGTDDADCTTEKTCGICGYVMQAAETEHSFTTYRSNGDATCGQDGTETAACDNPGCEKTDVRTEAGSKLSHDFRGEWKHDANSHWKICENGCGTTGEKSDHHGGTATCTENASCEACGIRYGNPGNHSLTAAAGKEATCTEVGTKAHWTCTECGSLFADEEGTQEVMAEELVIPALGHEYGSWQSGTDGTHTRTCVHADCEAAETNDCVYDEEGRCTVCSYVRITITVQPEPQTVRVGGNATFQVTADGINRTYQWQVSADSGASWTDIEGATEAVYTLENAVSGMNGYQYRCVITNGRDVAASEPASLAVSRMSSGGGSGSSSSSGTSSGGASVNTGTIYMDGRKGHVNTLTGIITGTTNTVQNGYSTWQLVDGNWKLRYADGTMAAGSRKTDAEGKLYEHIEWELINGAWYAFGADENARYGMIYDVDLANWFYVDISSGMKTGWILIEGNWYYFHDTSDGTRGRKLVNTRTPDGYWVDERGIWDGKEKAV